MANPDALRVLFEHGIYTLAYANAAPAFTSSPIRAATAGQPYTYQTSAQDPDGTTLSYLLVAGPAGMQIDSATGALTWDPTISSPASAEVELRVYDARGGFGTQQFTIAVSGGNHAPLLGRLPAVLQGAEGAALSLPVSASDVDGDGLVIWADHLPPGAVFDVARRTLEWTPRYDAAGTYDDVRIFVSDGKTIVSQSLTLSIAPRNQAPQLAQPAAQSIREGDTLRVQLVAQDADGETLTYASTNLPGGAFLDPHTGLFVWTPEYFQAGVYEVPFTVSDGQTATTRVVTFTVLNANAAPAFSPLANFVIAEGQQFRLRTFALDPDNPSYAPQERLPDGSLTPLEGTAASVTYTATGLPAGATFDDATAEWSWTPDYNAAGVYFATITATDDGDGTGIPGVSTTVIQLEVTNVNRPPQIAPLTAITVERDEIVNMSIIAVDPDGDAVTLAADGPFGDLPQFMTFVDAGQGHGSLRIAPTFQDRGDYAITLLATDDGNGQGPSARLTSSVTIVVHVHSASEPPVLSLVGDKVALVGQPLEFTIQVSDLDQDALDFTLSGLAPGATLVSEAVYGTARFSWTPTAADLGRHTATVTVTDSGNGDPGLIASAQAAFDIVVRTSNAQPQLAPIGDRTAQEATAFTLALSAFDPDGDPLTYAASNLPSGAHLDRATGILSWTPDLFQAGTYSDIVLSASDGNLTSSETISIVVANTNQAPVITPLPTLLGNEGETLRFVVSASDPDADPVVLSVVGLPSGATFNARTGEFSWTPDFSQAGDYGLVFTALDPQSGRGTLDVPLKILNVNRMPTLTVGDHVVALGEQLAFALAATDPDVGTTLAFAASGLPAGATLDAATGLLEWQPGAGQQGDYVVTFSVSDGLGTTHKAALLRATLATQAPSVRIELTPSFPVTPNQTVLVHAIADGVSPITSLTVTVNGQALMLDAQGRGSIMPVQPGRLHLTATAMDADGRTGTYQTDVKVRDPADLAPPAVSFAPLLGQLPIRSVTDVVGTIDDTNLDQWRLELAPLGSSVYRTLGTGDSPLANAVLATLDPGTLANGFYRLRITASDISGRTATSEIAVEINSSVKSGQYTRVETDLGVTLDGVHFDLVRSYDSLASAAVASVGHGWRMTLLDFNIETNAATTGRESAGVFEPLVKGSRLYLTLPGGSRVGFTFAPQRHEQPGLVYYTPAWIADAGVDATLTSAAAQLSLAGNRLYDLESASPYQPQSGQFAGPAYVLRTADGTSYELDASGHTTAIVTPAAARFTVSDSGVAGPSGAAITMVHDAQGRIVSITAPEGAVHYSYDELGNLAAARSTTAMEPALYGYSDDAANRLTLAATPTAGESIQYGTTVTTAPLAGNLGSLYQLTAAGVSGTLPAGETARYALGVRESEVAATSTGFVLIGIVAEATGGTLQPAVPAVAGLTPLVSRAAGGKSFALYAISDAGLKLIELSGAAATAGTYTLRVFVAGDVNFDHLVDGADAELLQEALGTSAGQPGYSPAADVDQDGTIATADQQILGSNFGFVANRPPQVTSTAVRTHVDLETVADVAALGSDPDGDPVFFHVVSSVGGTAVLTWRRTRRAFYSGGRVRWPGELCRRRGRRVRELRSDDDYSRHQRRPAREHGLRGAQSSAATR